MPELPEVETMRRGIAAAAGSMILQARLIPGPQKPIRVWPNIARLRRRCVRQRIEAVTRFGKRVVLELANKHRLVFEPRMTGLILVAHPPSETHLRFELQLEGGEFPRIQYWDQRGLGSVSCYSPEEFAAHLGPRQLGPDALQLSSDELQSRLGASRRPIKVALLDQRAVAGIGNLYASEILHVARIAPQQPCCTLTKRQWQRLHEAKEAVLNEAILYEGSTLSDGTYRNALNKAGGYQNHHRVYARAGQPCPACHRSSVVRIVQAQRSTFYCPRCQKPPRG